MELTLFLAQVMGVYFLVAGVGVLLNPARVKGAIAEAKKSYLLPYFDGAIALIVGLAIVLVHNVWDGLLETLITLIGWIAIVEGILLLLLPQKSISTLLEALMGAHIGRVMAVVTIVIGLFFVYQGFLM